VNAIIGLRENPFCKVYELNGLFMDLSAHIGGAGLSRFEVTDLLSTFKYDHELGLRLVGVPSIWWELTNGCINIVNIAFRQLLYQHSYSFSGVGPLCMV